MGEVWLARDIRLDRQVALKLLPAAWFRVAQRFDLGRLEFSDDPCPLGIEIPTGVAIAGLRSVTLSRDGTLVYRVDPSGATTLTWVDRQGREPEAFGDTEFWQITPRLSPDGRLILLNRPTDPDDEPIVVVLGFGQTLAE